jgi:hypothetical protein
MRRAIVCRICGSGAEAGKLSHGMHRGACSAEYHRRWLKAHGGRRRSVETEPKRHYCAALGKRLEPVALLLCALHIRAAVERGLKPFVDMGSVKHA